MVLLPCLLNVCQVDNWQILAVKEEDKKDRLLANDNQEDNEYLEHLEPERFTAEVRLD